MKTLLGQKCVLCGTESWEQSHEGDYRPCLNENCEGTKEQALRLGVIDSWCMDLEGDVVKQAGQVAQLPFLFRNMVIMPDGHWGYGMPIGGVAALKGVISPNLVGKDIGCGMGAVRTDIKVSDLSREALGRIMGEIRKAIPLGFNHHEEVQDVKYMPNWPRTETKIPICTREYDSARRQLGTLGGGNHFIEIQAGDDGYIWVMLHSGSRNLGSKVADHYNKVAIELNEKWHSSVPAKWELAFLPMDSDEGQAYMVEMNYCLEFARCNRELMMKRIKGIVASETGCDFDTEVNIHHNYAIREHHFGQNVMVHRKGATRACEGELGIIPGSQGTASYIVKGKGNIHSFKSCSHGAGRTMGRGQAKRELDFDAEVKRLNDKGILHSIRNVDDLDEAPGAYKDITKVMVEQEDLVDIVTMLVPLGVVKAPGQKPRRKKKK